MENQKKVMLSGIQPSGELHLGNYLGAIKNWGARADEFDCFYFMADMLIHVAPASGGTPVPELAKAFLVPKGCMVKINAAIWHLCPLPANNEVLHAMIVLPECTYANDCTVVEFEEKDWFKIIL